MRFINISLLFGVMLLVNGCNNRAIECVRVGEKSVCFLRKVQGLNGDDVYLTTVNDVCHRLSRDQDYVSDRIGAGEDVYFKVVENKLHIYGSTGEMIAPRSTFPVKVVFEPYTPTRDVKLEGFIRLDLGPDKMTWCLR